MPRPQVPAARNSRDPSAGHRVSHTMKMPIKTLLLLPTTIAACGILGPNLDSELDRQRHEWDALGRNSYSLVYRRVCFCPLPSPNAVKIVVFEDLVVSVSSASTGEDVDGIKDGVWPTIDELFDFVEQAIDEDADELIVAYDQEFFFPTLISIDWIRMAIDDEISHTASNLISVAG